MNNPYRDPPDDPPLRGHPTPVTSPLDDIQAPAISLLIASAISIALVSFGFAKQLTRLASINPINKEETAIQMILGMGMVAASIYVFRGALKMRKMEDYYSVRRAALLACMPIVGPCFLLPFGLWALSVIGRDTVRESFHS